MNLNVLTVPGDGIGIEVTKEAVRVLEHICKKFNHGLTLSEALLGGVAIHKTGGPFPDETRKRVTDAAREWNADVTWYRNNAHPVALIRLQANQNRPTLQIRRFEIADGQAHIHGKPTVDTPPVTEVSGGE